VTNYRLSKIKEAALTWKGGSPKTRERASLNQFFQNLKQDILWIKILDTEVVWF
jgi:hypothetical protein